MKSPPSLPNPQLDGYGMPTHYYSKEQLESYSKEYANFRVEVLLAEIDLLRSISSHFSSAICYFIEYGLNIDIDETEFNFHSDDKEIENINIGDLKRELDNCLFSAKIAYVDWTSLSRKYLEIFEDYKETTSPGLNYEQSNT